jgi:hypothetical protein
MQWEVRLNESEFLHARRVVGMLLVLADASELQKNTYLKTTLIFLDRYPSSGTWKDLLLGKLSWSSNHIST